MRESFCKLDSRTSSAGHSYYIRNVLNRQVSDFPLENLIPHLQSANAYIHHVMNTLGGRLLIHCNGGISRAPSFAIVHTFIFRVRLHDSIWKFIRVAQGLHTHHNPIGLPDGNDGVELRHSLQLRPKPTVLHQSQRGLQTPAAKLRGDCQGAAVYLTHRAQGVLSWTQQERVDNGHGREW